MTSSKCQSVFISLYNYPKETTMDIDIIDDAINEIEAICHIFESFNHDIFDGNDLTHLGRLLTRECQIIKKELNIPD